MGLHEPVPGLRPLVRVHHDANSAKRVEVVVPGDAVLEVPAEVADQLAAADPHFRVDRNDQAKRARPKRGNGAR